jgi:hypothetical protein
MTLGHAHSLRPARLALTLLTGVPLMGHAQQPIASISGAVTDRSTGAPIRGASVVLIETAASVTSDALGRFAHQALRAGTYVVQVRAIGYASTTRVIVLRDGEGVEYSFALDAAPHVLPEVTVERSTELWMQAFEERRTAGRGQYLTAREIRATGARRLSDLLRTVPGTRAICRRSRCVIRMSRAARECAPEYVLDGFPATNAVGPEMPLVGVMAIEIYRTVSETPIQFLGADTHCGTIVIWTKAGP